MNPQTIQIIIPNQASGYKIVHLTGWEGKCFILPRTELKSFASRPEIKDPGIYFLFGESDESTNQQLYIGESERFFERLTNHDSNKDFWNVAVIFSGGLNKADIKHLEYLSTSEAQKVKRFDLVNSVSPKENSLSEFDLIKVRNYFTNMSYLLEVLEYPVFQNITASAKSADSYYLKSEGYDAKSSLLEDGSLLVLAGSTCRVQETSSFTGWASVARKKFIEDGTLKLSENNEFYVFTKDVLFKSPSAAAATITGRSINGWTAWKDKDGKTLDENLRG